MQKLMTHTPVRTPRTESKELVFAHQWQQLMAQPYRGDPHCALAWVLDGYLEAINQRAATVAASFICWLGTPVGQSYLTTAQEIKENTHLVKFPYLAAWASANSRIRGANDPAKLLERILAPNPNLYFSQLPEVSREDFEVVEQIAIWFSTPEGENFLNQCQRVIDHSEQATSGLDSSS